MNILHISRRFYPCIGGTEKYIYEVSKRLIKRNINCRILTLNYDVLDKKWKLNNYDIVEGVEVFRIPGFGYYKKPFPLKIPVKLFRWTDIIHIHDLRFLFETSLLMRFLLNKKIVFSTHGFLLHTQDLKLIKSFMIPLYYRPVIENLVDAGICVSKQDYEYFKNWNIKNLYLIENGIDYEKFNKVERKPIKGEFLYFGRIDKNKGIDLLLNCLSHIKDLDWKLNIVGNGFKETVDELKFLTDRLKISEKILWHGFVEEDKLFNLISKSHLCFFPSIYEGFGFTLVEAMACGCICVTNNITAYKDIVKDGVDGFLVDFSNPEEAYHRIKKMMLASFDSLKNISINAKETARQYEWEGKITEIVDVYRSLL